MIIRIIKFILYVIKLILSRKKNKVNGMYTQPTKEVTQPIVEIPDVIEPKSKTIISFEDYVTAQGKYPDRLKSPELTEDKIENATNLLVNVNLFLDHLGITQVNVTSGFRPTAVNKTVSGAGAKSTHLVCLGIDILDNDKKIWEAVLRNLDKAEELNLAFEDVRWTPNWVHIQLGLPSSGKRIFRPSMKDALVPDVWDGVYDSKYDLKKDKK